MNEARRHGAEIHLPDINKSNYTTSIAGDNIYLGWVHVKNLDSGMAEKIIAERNAYGVFRDLFDFLERLSPGSEQLHILIKSGAFRFTGKSKKELMWEQLINVQADDKVQVKPLFAAGPKEFCIAPG